MYLWLCPRFTFFSLWQLSLWLWLSFYKALQFCSGPNWATRSCLKEKNLTKLVAIKTCRPHLFQMTCSGEQPKLFANCSIQRLRFSLSANAPILHKLVSYCFSSLLTFLVMESRLKQAYLELQKVRMSQNLKSKKKTCSSYILILVNSRQP